jgi:hypothetical protein
MNEEPKHHENEEHEKKEYKIIVNGLQKIWKDKEISYTQVVSLAYDGKIPVGPDWIFTVTYYKGDDKKHEGHMTEGDTVRVKNDMVFNVTGTNKS